MPPSNPSQAFRLSVSKETIPLQVIHIEPRHDPKTRKHVIFWKDIQRVFAGAKYVLNGEKVVSFMVDDDFNDIVPARILYHPGKVLIVVTADSDNLSTALPSSTLEGTTPLSQQQVSSPMSDAPATTPVKHTKPTAPAPAATSNAPGHPPTPTVPPATLNDSPSLTSSTLVDNIGKTGALNTVSSKGPHLEGELAALKITTVAEKSTSKLSKKTVVVAPKAQQTWSEVDQCAAEKSLTIFVTCMLSLLSWFCYTDKFEELISATDITTKASQYVQKGGLNQKGRQLFFSGNPLQCTKILAHSKDAKMQCMAAAALIVATNNGVDAVDREAFRIIMHLVQTDSATIQDKASTVLIRLVKDDTNKGLVIELGGLRVLRHLLLSIESLRRNYLAAISRMASKDSIARVIMQDEETVAAIARLVQGNDLEGQKQALGAIANLSKMEGFMQVAIQAGMMPTIVRLTRSAHGDFGMRCLSALESMTQDKTCLGQLRLACPDIFKTLRSLMDSIHEETMAAATITLYNFSTEEQYRHEIVAAGALTPILKLLNSRSERVLALGIGLIRNLVGTAGVNDLPIVQSRCLERLIEILFRKKSPIPKDRESEPRIFVIGTFTELLTRKSNCKAILDMNLVQRLSACAFLMPTQAELRPRMLKMGIIDTMFQLAKSTKASQITMMTAQVLHQIAEDPAVFVTNWTTPAEGLQGYIVHLLESDDMYILNQVLDLILLLVRDPAMKSLVEQAEMVKMPYLRMVERIKGTPFDETLPTEIGMLSILAFQTALLTMGQLDW
ncbi:Vacuolar protein 8 [Mortierella alpina]|nr:Vacuolar protein 8 [Mortierella alpina]